MEKQSISKKVLTSEEQAMNKVFCRLPKSIKASLLNMLAEAVKAIGA